jgi:hypothetical protein
MARPVTAHTLSAPLYFKIDSMLDFSISQATIGLSPWIIKATQACNITEHIYNHFTSFLFSTFPFSIYFFNHY